MTLLSCMCTVSEYAFMACLSNKMKKTQQIRHEFPCICDTVLSHNMLRGGEFIMRTQKEQNSFKQNAENRVQNRAENRTENKAENCGRTKGDMKQNQKSDMKNSQNSNMKHDMRLDNCNR